MNFTLAPAKSPLTSSEYISKPLTMSLPTWANGPVIGAMKPTISSCAAAPEGVARFIPNARHPPININPVRLGDLLVMVPTPFPLAAGLVFTFHPLDAARAQRFSASMIRGQCATGEFGLECSSSRREDKE